MRDTSAQFFRQFSSLCPRCRQIEHMNDTKLQNIRRRLMNEQIDANKLRPTAYTWLLSVLNGRADYIPVCADVPDCHLHEFACDGRCIPRLKLCDYDVDCVTDAADESSLLCSKSTDSIITRRRSAPSEPVLGWSDLA